MSESTLDDPRCGTCGKDISTAKQLFECRAHFTGRIRELDTKLAASEKRVKELEFSEWMCKMQHPYKEPITDKELSEENQNLRMKLMSCSWCSEYKPNATEICCDDCNASQVDSLELAENRAEAWYRVYEYGEELFSAAYEDIEDDNFREGEDVIAALQEKYSEALEHAHSIDNRRCPECKGDGGHISDGEFAGFVPCPECDGVPWGEVLAEREYQASLPTLTNDKEAGR